MQSKQNAEKEFNESDPTNKIISNQIGLLSHHQVCGFSLYLLLFTGVD